MKTLLALGAAVLGFSFLGSVQAKAHDFEYEPVVVVHDGYRCNPQRVVVVRDGYENYAPVYAGGYGYNQHPYRRHYVRYVNPSRPYYRPRVAFSFGY